MSLLNAFFLLGGLTLAIPVLVHLVRKDKSDIVKFSSLMFLLRIPRKTVRQYVFRDLPLMLVRLLLLLLLIGAFARPYLTEMAGTAETTEDSRGVVVLMDNSYSMRYGTNFERMKAEARDRIDTLTPEDRAVLIAFSDGAQVLGTPTSDPAELRARVDAVEPSFDRTAFYEAFTMADRALAAFEGLNRELVVISDFQRNGWNRSSRESVIDADVRTELVDIGVENPDNVGFESVSVDATVFTRTYDGQLLARINNYNIVSPATVAVSLEINGRTVETRTVTIAAETSELVEFTGFELALGYSEGRVMIEDEDALSIDNEFLFSVLRRDRLALLVVDAGRPDQSRFLLDAFAADPDLPFAVDVDRIENVSAADLDDYDVVIVNDVPRLDDAFAARLAERRADGQGQWVFLGEMADAAWWNGYEPLPVTMGERVFVERDRNRPFYSITTIERSHPIVTALDESARFTLNSAQFFAFANLAPEGDALVMARFEDGSPSIVESGADARGLIVMGSSVDNGPWNDFPLKPSFVRLVHEASRYLAGYQDRRSSYQMGEAVAVPPAVDGDVAAITPSGQRLTLGNEASTGPRFFTPEETGFYEVRAGPDTSQVAVNLPLSESVLERIPGEDLLASVRRLDGEARRGALLAEADTDDFARRQNWWWYLLLLALLAGVAETVLGNRVTRTQREAAPAIRGSSA